MIGRRILQPLVVATLGALAGSLQPPAALAQTGAGQPAAIVTLAQDPAQTRRELAAAQAQAQAANARAQKLEASAAQAVAAADKTAQAAAALAARIQQAEAQIAASEAAIRLIEQQRQHLRARLAARQKPLVELAAALQKLARRPPVASLLRPGSVRDTVHMRALLETMLPQVQARTAALRGDIAHARALAQQARASAQQRKAQIRALGERRRALAVLETRQRLSARQANGHADREAERALALAEQARDLGGLVQSLEQSAGLREALARLPGPVMRPNAQAIGAALFSQTMGAQNPATTAPASPAAPERLAGFQLPVAGRLVSGFGDASRGSPARGVSLAVRPQAQVVAPAAGRVAFADSYAGFGKIVIIDHGNGWTSLLTGLGRLGVQVGDTLLAGSPLGNAGTGGATTGGPTGATTGRAASLTFELRHHGVPANPFDQLHAN